MKHTIDAIATVTLEVEARSEQAAMAKVRGMQGLNPFVGVDDGVELYEFTIGDNLPGRVAEYQHDEDDRPGIGTHDIPREPVAERASGDGTATADPSGAELRELSTAVRRAFRAASGDSNDAEIDRLREALDAALRLRFPEIDPDTGKLRA